MDKVRALGQPDVPLNKRAYILYHMAKQGIYDPDFYSLMESGLALKVQEGSKQQSGQAGERLQGEQHITARYAMAAVIGYWRSNCGQAWALKFWEQHMSNQAQDLHVQDVIELCQAFRENRTHHRDHMRRMLANLFKESILEKWLHEVEYHQRRLYELMVEMEHLDYYDQQLWQACFDTIGQKKMINNLTFFSYFNETMQKFNADPKSPFFKKLDSNIESLKEKHYTVNREWRYDFQEGRMRPLDELIARREQAKQDDQYIGKGGLDQTLIQRAIEAEKKMKRLRMAKYSVELFDEIVMEMMREKRTMMEMMAELDVDDEKIMESQQRIANRRLKAGLSITVD